MKIKQVSLLLLTVSTCFFSYAQSKELFETVRKLDSVFFHAYNSCDLETQAKFYSDSIEFFHDQGGFINSKKAILDGTKKNICGKVTRELVANSIEVYPIKNYGAIEMGQHKFHNSAEKDAVPHASKFIIIWQNKNDRWIIAKVVSLH